MKEIRDSIYTALPGMTVTKVLPDDKELKDAWADREVPGQGPIERALLKFGFLTAELLDRYLKTKDCKRLNTRDSLHKLFEKGVVEHYSIEAQDSTVSLLDIYLLTKDEERAVRKKNRPTAAYRFELTDIAYIMRGLSAAQWHIALLERKGTKEICFNGRADSGHAATPVILPSLARCKIKGSRSMVLAAIPAPKGEKKRDLGAFLENFIQLSEYLLKRKDLYPRYAMVILCESSAQAGEVALFLKTVKETAWLFALYCLDMNTVRGMDPLSVLYDVNAKEGQTDYSLINLSS